MQITFRVTPQHIFSVNNNMELKLAGHWFDVEPHAISKQPTRFYATAMTDSKIQAQAIKLQLIKAGIKEELIALG